MDRKIKKRGYKDEAEFYREINRVFLTGYTKYKRGSQEYQTVEEIQVDMLASKRSKEKP